MSETLNRSNNSLADIIEWIRSGDCVVLHSNSTNAHIYHNCKDNTNKERFIYIDVAAMPSLLHQGEWPWYIEDAGCDSCRCSLKQRALAGERSANTHWLRL